MASSTRCTARAAQANSTRAVARASSPRALTFGIADPARNAKGAAREILKRKTNSVTAGARRRQKELRGGADTDLGIDTNA